MSRMAPAESAARSYDQSTATTFEEITMTDEPSHNEPSTEGTTPAADETFAWSADAEKDVTTPPGQGREWVSQLQSMIEQVATQAAPVIREVGAKAAELAVIAGDKAGPMAQRAAQLTGQAGQKLAERSRDFAAELRRDQAADDDAPAGGDATEADATEADAPSTTADVH
jgi:hypothetical protein